MKGGQYKGKTPIENFNKAPIKDIRQREFYKQKIDNNYYNLKQDSETIINLLKQNNIYDIQKYIIDNNISLQEIDENNDTILHKILLEQELNDDDKYELIKFCLERGASVNCKNIYGITPLHLTAKYYYKDILELLIIKGADINITDNQLRTPLHYALMGHEIKCLEQEHKYDIISEEGINIDKETISLADVIIKKLIDDTMFNKYLYHIKNTIMNSEEMFYNDYKSVIDKNDEDINNIILNSNKSEEQKKKEINESVFKLNNVFIEVLKTKLKTSLKDLEIFSGINYGFNPVGDNKKENTIMKYSDIKDYFDDINKSNNNKYNNSISKTLFLSNKLTENIKIISTANDNINIFINDIVWMFYGGFILNSIATPNYFNGKSDTDFYKDEMANVLIDNDTTGYINPDIMKSNNIDLSIYNFINIIKNTSPTITRLTKNEIDDIENKNKRIIKNKEKTPQITVNYNLPISNDNIYKIELQNINTSLNNINLILNSINDYSIHLNIVLNDTSPLKNNIIWKRIEDTMLDVNIAIPPVVGTIGNPAKKEPYPKKLRDDIKNIYDSNIIKINNSNINELKYEYEKFISQFFINGSLTENKLKGIQKLIKDNFNIDNNVQIFNNTRLKKLTVSTGNKTINIGDPLPFFFPKYSSSDSIYVLMFKRKLYEEYIVDNTIGINLFAELYNEIQDILNIYSVYPSLNGFDPNNPMNVIRNPKITPISNSDTIITINDIDFPKGTNMIQFNAKYNYYINEINDLRINLETNIKKFNDPTTNPITNIDFYKNIVQIYYTIINICVQIHIVSNEYNNITNKIYSIKNFLITEISDTIQYSHRFYVNLIIEKCDDILNEINNLTSSNINQNIYNDLRNLVININEIIKQINAKYALISIENYNNKFTNVGMTPYFEHDKISINDINNIFYKNIPYLEIIPLYSDFTLLINNIINKDKDIVKNIKKLLYESFIPQLTKYNYSLFIDQLTLTNTPSQIGYLGYDNNFTFITPTGYKYGPDFSINQIPFINDANLEIINKLNKPEIDSTKYNVHLGKLGNIKLTIDDKKEKMIPIVSELLDEHINIIKYILVQNILKEAYVNINNSPYKEFNETTKKIFNVGVLYPTLIAIAKTTDKIIIEFINNIISLFASDQSYKKISGKLSVKNYQDIYIITPIIPVKRDFKLSLIEVINNIINPANTTDYSLYTNILTKRVQTKKIKNDNNNIYIVDNYSLFNLTDNNLCYKIDKTFIEKLLTNKFLQLNKKDINGDTAIYYAIGRNNLDVIKHLLSNNKNKILLNTVNKLKSSPLDYSIKNLLYHIKNMPDKQNFLNKLVEPMSNSIKQNILDNTIIKGIMVTNSSIVLPFTIFLINKYFYDYMLDYPNGWTYSDRLSLENITNKINISYEFESYVDLEKKESDLIKRQLDNLPITEKTKMQTNIDDYKKNMETYKEIMDSYVETDYYEEFIETDFDKVINLLSYVKKIKDDITDSTYLLHPKISLFLKDSLSKNEHNKINNIINKTYEKIFSQKIKDYTEGKFTYNKDKNKVLYDVICIIKNVLKFTLITSYYYTITKTLTLYLSSSINKNKQLENDNDYADYIKNIVDNIMIAKTSKDGSLAKYIINEMPEKLIKVSYKLYDGSNDPDNKLFISDVYNQVIKMLLLNPVFPFEENSTFIKKIKEDINVFYNEYINLFLKNIKILIDGYLQYINIEYKLIEIVTYIENIQ